MAQIELQPSADKKTRRRLPASPFIDMTPMVDLGFLLISFFIFTTTMAEKTTTPLVMPAPGEPMDLRASRALTILLGKNNKVFAYEGLWEDAMKNNRIEKTSYDEYQGIGALIRAKQEQLQRTDKEGRDGLVLLIRPATQASYKNLIDALDEATINGVKKYAILEPDPWEKNYLEK